jgi:hypothetical protein
VYTVPTIEKRSVILLPRTRQGIRQGIRLFIDFSNVQKPPGPKHSDIDLCTDLWYCLLNNDLCDYMGTFKHYQKRSRISDQDKDKFSQQYYKDRRLTQKAFTCNRLSEGAMCEEYEKSKVKVLLSSFTTHSLLDQLPRAVKALRIMFTVLIMDIRLSYVALYSRCWRY